MPGPLEGLKVIEMAGLGPAPFCAMLFADMGAQVVRIERPGGAARLSPYDITARGRPALDLDLRAPEGVQTVLRMLDTADVLIEGFRPGVMERLGLGPDVCLARRPSLVYGRMTGWGQHGPLAQAAGHDINYLALTGALHAVGLPDQPPVPPLNLVADFGGGAMMLAFGVLAASFEARRSGQGQVVDAAMVDGVASLMTQPHGSLAAGVISTERGTNPTDSGAPFYDAYACSDGLWVSLAAVETKFYAQALGVLGLPELLADQWKREAWQAAKARIAERFATRSRAQWCQAFEGVDACFAPVLTLEEAPQHPHLKERGVYDQIDGVTQPMPAPRFSRTPSPKPKPFRPWSKDEAREILAPWLDDAAIEAARQAHLLD
jgi:alpha-methylacyl-CoA racemase